ncbi:MULTISPECIES: organomercurial lyase [Halorussus]|uniref:organomercurial lyase n=1 Tax=Halorussus TaxID=1070314 RepID=UPI00209FE6FB|nr:organomercurial lyase [Halorussus vallis]USZ77974.1 alkylmercury lyase family protein [Halorussus vallis]USZ78006.1 alkylmercury lyase family protein [Halorussus vallis]
MSDHECACGCRSDRQGSNANATTERWFADDSVLTAELPADVRSSLARLIGVDTVETLGDWIIEVRRRTVGRAIQIDDLCHADEKTDHRGELDGETYYFRCFYDAVALSALTETPVDIRTESPDGTVIKARANGTTDLTVTPETAVFSFGIEDLVDSPVDGTLSHEDIYAAVCPYVRAFPNREAYERWEKTVPAATVALPLPGATDIAAGLIE